MTFVKFIGDVEEIARVGKEKLSVEWRIRNVLELRCEREDFYASAAFGLGDERWRLILYPNWSEGWNSESGWLRLDLTRNDNCTPDTFRFSVGVRTQSGEVDKRGNGEMELSCEDSWFCKEFYSRTKLAKNLTRLMPDGVLSITCEIERLGAAEDNNVLLQKTEESLKKQIKLLQDKVDKYELESETYKKQIHSFENHKLSVVEEYERKLEEKMIIISRLKRGSDQLEKEVKSLMEQNKDLNSKCEELTLIVSEAKSKLSEASIYSELHKKEMAVLMEHVKNIERIIEDYRISCDKNNKQMDTLESEQISIAEDQAAFEDDAAVHENSNNDDHKESNMEKKVNQVKSTKKISLPTRHSDVIRSLKSLLAGGSRADFTLKSGDGEWPVHRAILEGRSGRFETLFQKEWAQRDEARLDDVTAGVLEGILHFLYVGEVKNMSAENVRAIYEGAHALDLKELKFLCVEYMKEWMCPELVGSSLIVAERYREVDLKKRALECHFRESDKVVTTVGWKELKNHPAIFAILFVDLFFCGAKQPKKEQKYDL